MQDVHLKRNWINIEEIAIEETYVCPPSEKPEDGDNPQSQDMSCETKFLLS